MFVGSRFLFAPVALIIGSGIAFSAAADGILGCGPDGIACSITLQIDGQEVASGNYVIDSSTGGLFLLAPVVGNLGGADLAVNSIFGNVDPILGFGIGAGTGLVGDTFSVSLSLPIALSGALFADSSVSYSLTALSAAGAEISPLFGHVVIAQEVDTTPGGLDPLNKGVDVGDGFFFLTGPETQNSPVFTASDLLVGDLQYVLMSITVAFSLSPQSNVGISGFVQQEVVPEPATVLLIGFGLAAIAWRRRTH